MNKRFGFSATGTIFATVLLQIALSPVAMAGFQCSDNTRMIQESRHLDSVDINKINNDVFRSYSESPLGGETNICTRVTINKSKSRTDGSYDLHVWSRFYTSKDFHRTDFVTLVVIMGRLPGQERVGSLVEVVQRANSSIPIPDTVRAATAMVFPPTITIPRDYRQRAFANLRIPPSEITDIFVLHAGKATDQTKYLRLENLADGLPVIWSNVGDSFDLLSGDKDFVAPMTGPDYNLFATAIALSIVAWAAFDQESFCEALSFGAESCEAYVEVRITPDGTFVGPTGEPVAEIPDADKEVVVERDPLDLFTENTDSLDESDWKRKYAIGMLIPLASYLLDSGIAPLPDDLDPLTETNMLRPNKGGSPLFASRRIRNGKAGFHLGVDRATTPGDRVFATYSGEATFKANGHKGFGEIYLDMESGHRQDIHYVTATQGIRDGQTWQVKKGDVIGYAQDIHSGPNAYPDSVPNHIHSTYKTEDGFYLDPLTNLVIAPKRDPDRGNFKTGPFPDADWVARLCGTPACLSSDDELPKEH